jgi:hypothetical protein
MWRIPVRKIKNIIPAVLLLVLCSIAFSACGKQKDIPVFTYNTNDDNTITITGLTARGKAEYKIVVPSQLNGVSVTEIGDEAFRDEELIREITIEEGIVSIGANAFLNCASLEQLSLPSSVQEIGTNVVVNTKWEKNQLENASEIVVNGILIEVKQGLTSYTVPDNVSEISSGVFYNYTDLEEVQFNSSLEKIGNYAFSGCASLRKAVLPSDLKEIGYGAFSGCTALDVTVNKTIESIGHEAFLDVSHITYAGELQGSPWGAKGIN